MSSELQSVITASRDVATGLAAIIACVVAVLGLKAWRKQLRGRTEYDLARRLLRAVYRVRDELRSVRNPFMSPGEIHLALEDVEGGSSSARNRQDVDKERLVYQRRWERLAQAMSDLEVEQVEAEVLWGPGVKEQTRELRACVGKLRVCLGQHIENKHRQTNERRPDPERVKTISAVVYFTSDAPEDDHFSGEIAFAVAQIEELLRPKLAL